MATAVTNSAVSAYERGKVHLQSHTLRKILGASTSEPPVSILDPTQTFIETVRSQVDGRAQGQPEPASAVPLDLPGEGRLDVVLRTEIALLASKGARLLPASSGWSSSSSAGPRGGSEYGPA